MVVMMEGGTGNVLQYVEREGKLPRALGRMYGE